MKNIIQILIILVLLPSFVFAQDTLPFSGKTYYNWYFGFDAGITFNTPNREPVFLAGTVVGGGQNSSTVSDRQGNFLFHTDGQLLESARHQIIDDDMGGNDSQSEGSVLAPLNDGKFIFFTTVFANSIYETEFDPPRYLNDSTGLKYSIFSYDSTTNELKYYKHKVQLDKDFHSEAIELTYSAITNKYILVCPDTKGTISAYEFDLDGNLLRQSKQKFFEMPFKTNLREIRINRMGDRIVVSLNHGYYKFFSEEKGSWKNSHLYIADLDATTLRFSNYKDLELAWYGVSAMEFSPNSNYLYFYGCDSVKTFTSNETLFRYNLRDSSLRTIYSSPYPISRDYRYGDILDTIVAVPADLRIAPNNKIYISRGWGNHLSSIEDPNNSVDPQYRLAPVYLGINYGKQTYCEETLPNILSASFAPVFVRSEIILCEGETLELFAKTQLPDTEATYSWAGPNNYVSDEQFPVIEDIRLDQAGLYVVTVKSNDKTYTAETFVRVKPSPHPSLKAYPDKFVCDDGDIVLSLTEDYAHYLWSTGDTAKYITVSKSGTYGVTVTNANGCTSYAEIEVMFARDYELPITGDTLKCPGEAVTIGSGEEYPQYHWSTGETTRSITVTEAKRYTLTVTTEEGCEVSRTIEVRDYPPVRAELKPTPTAICSGDSVLLEAKYTSPSYSYIWNTGETTNSIYVSRTGTYKLKITNTQTGCTDSTEIEIRVEDSLQPTIAGSNICSGEVATLTALPNDTSYSYEWSNGETTPIIQVSQPGTYRVTVSKGGCVGTAEFTVNASPSPEFEILGENLLCNSETATLTCSADFAEYLWSTNEISKSIVVSEAGTYTLTVTDTNGCSATQEFTVSKYAMNFDISKTAIDFGKTYISERKSGEATLSNHSGFAVTLSNGQSIADGESYDLDYDFVPTQLGEFADILRVHITAPCDTVVQVPVTATVYARVTISTEDVHTQIGRVETVPVYLECEADLPSEDYTITTSIDKTAFYTKDDYTINQTEPLHRAKTQIHSLTGTILLSDKLVYDIAFPSYEFTNPYIELIDRPGKIYIDSICIFPLRNIIAFAPTTVELSPNPASGQLNIDIATGMQGTMSLELVSSEGRVVYSDTWLQSTRTKRIELSTGNIPSGLYQVRLITPYDAVSKSVVVVE